jgi:hypothetical protein
MTKQKKVWYTPEEAIQFFPWINTVHTVRMWIRNNQLKARQVRNVSGKPQGNRYMLHIDDIKAFKAKSVQGVS